MPDDPRAGRPDRRKIQTRQALVSATRRLLVDHRPGDLTVAQIAEHADVGVGTFYNHFRSIERLVEAAADEAFFEVETTTRALRRPGDTPAEQLVLGILVTLRDVPPNLVWAAVRPQPEDGQPSPLLRAAVGLLTAGSDHGGFGLDPQLAVYLVAGAVNGTLQATAVNEHPPDAHAQVAEALLRMLGCAPEDAHRRATAAAERLAAASTPEPQRGRI